MNSITTFYFLPIEKRRRWMRFFAFSWWKLSLKVILSLPSLLDSFTALRKKVFASHNEPMMQTDCFWFITFYLDLVFCYKNNSVLLFFLILFGRTCQCWLVGVVDDRINWFGNYLGIRERVATTENSTQLRAARKSQKLTERERER